MRIWIGVVAFLCSCTCLFTAANAQTPAERMDNLTALYMVRASESLCGFKMTDEQRSETLRASKFLEGKLELSSEKADELYKKVVKSMEAQKGGGLCDPNGEWAGAFKQAVENLAGSTKAPSAPATTPPGSGAAAQAPVSSPSAAQPKVSGLEASKAILGNTISGRRDGGDYVDYYAPDGKIVALDDGDVEVGKWMLEGDLICTDYPSEGKVCYRIEVSGETATFTDPDGIGFRGTILKGNPKNL